MTALEVRLLLYGALISGLLGALAYWDHHERVLGRIDCQKADTTALQAQLAKDEAALSRYKDQLHDANQKLLQAQAAIDAAAATPVPVLLCRKADSGHVPGLPPSPQGGTPASGAPGDVREPDFDPSPDLRRLSLGYERRVNGYRDALNQWPK